MVIEAMRNNFRGYKVLLEKAYPGALSLGMLLHTIFYHLRKNPVLIPDYGVDPVWGPTFSISYSSFLLDQLMTLVHFLVSVVKKP